MRKLPFSSFFCSPLFKVTAHVGLSSLTMSHRGVVRGSGHFVVRAVKSSQVLMRRCELPPGLQEEALASAVAFKAEEELPFTAEEAQIVVAEPKVGLFFATKRDLLPEGSYDAIVPAPLALVHFASYFSLPGFYVIVYADEEEVTFIKIKEGIPILCTTVKKGPEMEKELQRRYAAYGWGADTPTLILGERAAVFGDEIELEERFGLSPLDLHAQALLVGLSLLPFSLPIERFDFGNKRISYKKMPLVKPLVICLLSLIALFLVSEEWLAQESRALAERLGVQNAQEYIDKAQSQVALAAYPYPLKPQSPRFSDVLAWISKEAPEGVQIDKMHYSYITMPSLKSPKERYCVQVDMTFLVDSVQTARLFHERLMAPNPFVVQDAHFVWQSSDHGYRVSFRLKDRTFYELS